jgi:hypothetical protein
MWAKDASGLTADELIAGTAIAAKFISQNPGIDESAIDAALTDAYAKRSSADECGCRRCSAFPKPVELSKVSARASASTSWRGSLRG